MKEQLITFDTAKLANEKGFDFKGIISKGYSKEGELGDNAAMFDYTEVIYTAPTQSLLQKWLREEKYIDVFVIKSIKECAYDWELVQEDKVVKECGQYYIVYEEALEEGLKQALNCL